MQRKVTVSGGGDFRVQVTVEVVERITGTTDYVEVTREQFAVIEEAEKASGGYLIADNDEMRALMDGDPTIVLDCANRAVAKLRERARGESDRTGGK
jgi:hypothetical protein